MSLSPLYCEAGCVEEARDKLADENLWSDECFVEYFVEGRILWRKGPRYIRQGLQQKDICALLIKAYLNQSSSDWLDLAALICDKKYDDKPVIDYKYRAKRLGFMPEVF